MTIDEIRDWILPVASVVNAFAIIIGFWITSRRFRRQTHVMVFLEFTKRFEDLFARFPSEARLLRVRDGRDLPAKEAGEATDVADRIYALISQEFYMHRQKYLGEDIWRLWKPAIEQMLQSAILIREWKNVRSRFDSYPAFAAFVEDCHARAETHR